MTWLLFIQIELILLTIGFLALLTVSHWFTTKNGYRQELWETVTKALAQAASSLNDKTNSSQELEKALDNLLKKYSSNKIENKE